MTQDEIIEMARQAGSEAAKYPSLIPKSEWETLERFAKLVRDDYSNKHAQLWLKRIDDAVNTEREACAKLCDKFNWGQAPKMIQDAIRARSGATSRGETQ